MTRVDPLTLPRIAPSKLGHPAPRRHPEVNGIPDPRTAYRKTLAEKLLFAITDKAFRAHVASAISAEQRAIATEQLLADIDSRYPPDEMVILRKHGMTTWRGQMYVEIASGAQAFALEMPGAGRDLPAGREAHRFTARSDQAGGPIASVPATVQPIFDLVATAHARRQSEFIAARSYPLAFEKREGRPPKWAEIATAFPRLGAWMAAEREKA